MGRLKEAANEIESFIYFVRQQQKKVYETLCEFDLLQDQAGIALRTELYKEIAERITKPTASEEPDVKVRMYCAFVETEMRGIGQVPPREDPRYQKIIDVIQPIIKEVSDKADNIGEMVMDEIKIDVIKTVAELIEMDEQGETSSKIVGGAAKYTCVRRCSDILNKYDPLEFDVDGLKRTTVYIILSLGISGVEFPHQILKKSDYKNADELADFLYRGFELIHADHNTIIPDKESEKFRSMVSDLWVAMSELKETQMETGTEIT